MNQASLASPAPLEEEQLAPSGWTCRLRLVAGQLLGNDRFILPALFVVGLAPRLWDLGERGFWLDELSAVTMAATEFPTILRALGVEANMTLYYLALFSWLRAVGVGANEALIRLPSALFGAASVPLVYLLGSRLHSRAAGLGAAVLLAVNGFHVLMSQEARSYGLLSSLTILSFLLLDRAVCQRRPAAWALHGLVSALAFHAHFYTAFILLAQGLFILSRRSLETLRGLVVSGLVFALLTLPLAPFFLMNTGAAKLSHVVPPRWNDFTSFWVDYSGGREALLAIYLALGLLGLGLASGGARSRAYRDWLLLSWLCVPVGLAFGISLLVRPIVEDRYLFAVLPALPLLASVGLTTIPRPVALATLGLAVGLSILALQGDLSVRRLEQWRQAAAYAMNGAQPRDGWVFISKKGQSSFEYYAGWRWGRAPAAPYEDIFERFNWDDAASVPKYRGVLSMANLAPFAAGHPRIWLVLSHEFDSSYGGDLAAPVRDWLTRNGYAVLQQRQFRGVRVMLYQRRAATEVPLRGTTEGPAARPWDRATVGPRGPSHGLTVLRS